MGKNILDVPRVFLIKDDDDDDDESHYVVKYIVVLCST